MIEMFSSGTSNGDRMVLGHSSAFPDWGILYRDSDDSFVFQSRGGPPLSLLETTMTIDLGQGVSTNVPFGATSDEDGAFVLSVVGEATTYSLPSLLVPAVASIRRTTTHGFGENLLKLQIPSGSSAQSQYIECANTTGVYEVDFRVDGDGEIFTDVGITTPADFAEMIRVTTGAESVEPGDVVVIDAANPRAVLRSSRAHSTLVAGVYSTKPGVVGSEREWDLEAPVGSPEALAGGRIPLKRPDMARLYDEVPVAVVGIVPCKVSAENGPIQPGDLLVTSTTPGHAMRADAPSVGTVVGKALDSLANGTGRIRILVTLQ